MYNRDVGTDLSQPQVLGFRYAMSRTQTLWPCEGLAKHLGASLAKGQEGCVGRGAVLAEGAVQVQRVRHRPSAGDGGREAQLVAVTLVQGVLAGLHIAHIGVPGAVQLERPGLAALTSIFQH